MNIPLSYKVGMRALLKNPDSLKFYKRDLAEIHYKFVNEGFGYFLPVYCGPLHMLDDEVICIKLTVAGRMIAEQLAMPS